MIVGNDGGGLQCFIVETHDARRVSAFTIRLEYFGVPVTIVLNQDVRQVEDGCLRAIIILQIDNDCVRPIMLEVQDVRHFCAAPGVNGLVVVAYGEDGGVLAGEHAQPLVLQRVRVLELVDEDGAPIDPAKVVMYSVDKETVPAGTPNGGLCKATSFLATYTVASPGAEDITIAAFEGDAWPPASEATLCGTFTYSSVR